MHTTFGPLALLGSGETSLAGGRLFETLARRLPQPLRIAILETPAGFELNSPQVAARVGDFLKTRLQNFDPVVEIVPARKRGTPFSPEEASILSPLLHANLVFMGPGSPTYAVRQLRGSLAWDLVRLRHRLGAALVFASAATLAVGARVVPVYEIYKVGEDVSAPAGLEFFADFGLSLSCVPHWNNTDGGAEVDTSRCFIGIERFKQWQALLPPGHHTLGLDEHTGVILDFASGECTVSGVSSVTLLAGGHADVHPTGDVFPVSALGTVRCPQTIQEGLPPAVWDMAEHLDAHHAVAEAPAEVFRLLAARQQARQDRDWAASDSLRLQMAALGWAVQDSADGQILVRC